MIKSKPKTKKIMTNKIYILLGFVAILAMVGWYIKSMMISPQVALIAEPSKQMCVTNISSMSFHDECGNPGTFKRAVYTCSNGSTAEKLAGGLNCITYSDVLKEAQNNCGQTCTGPSPVPSCVPHPCPNSATCKLMALPSGQVYCPVSTSAPSPSLRPSPSPSPTPTPTARPSTAPSPVPTYYPSAVPSAPPACKAQEVTHYAFRDKCVVPAGAIDQYRFIDYICGDETEPRTMGGSDSCQFYTSLKSGAEFYCRKNVCTPTPTPVPTAGPGCYTEQRFCIQSLVGGKCPVATICPSPTPTPTPTPKPTATPVPSPVPSPVFSTKPSTTPTPATCGTSLNKWQFRESCGAKMYRYIDFNCSGTTQGQAFGNPNICKSEAEWVAEARTTCMNTKCATPTPTPVMSTSPRPVPTATPTPPNCLRVFGRRICWPTFRR